MSSQNVSIEDVDRAKEIIEPHLPRTPLIGTTTLSEMTGSSLLLKAENLQKTGSFKTRGALNAVLNLSAEDQRKGVIGVSAGNHGAALAYAAHMVGIRATVVMPRTATRSKIAAIKGYGGEVVLVPGDQLMESMDTIQRERGHVFIHPFDRPEIIAGQGTVGLEIVEDFPDVELVVVPVGGGGLISGVLTAVKSLRPETVVVGVEPEGSNVVSQSLALGEPTRLKEFRTIADGLNAPWSGEASLTIIQRLVDDVVTVSDEAIARAMALIVERTKLLVEPAGAAAVAALLDGKIRAAEGKRVVAILSGGNVDLSGLSDLLKVAEGAAAIKGA